MALIILWVGKQHEFLFEPDDEPHHTYATNSWYRLAKHAAGRRTNCYVCTRMPHSVSYPRLTAGYLGRNATACLTAYVSAPRRNNNSISERGSKWFDPTSQLNTSKLLVFRDTTPPGVRPGQFNFTVLNCTKYLEGPPWALAIPPGKHAPYLLTVSPVNGTSPFCYYQNGSLALGNMSTSHCDRIIFNAPACYQVRACGRAGGRGACGPAHRDPARVLLKQPCSASGSDNSSCYSDCDGYAPGPNSTRVLDGVYWMCGHKVYLYLPPNWGGLCAPVRLTNETFILVPKNESSRVRREAKDLPVFPSKDFLKTRGADVPHEFRLHTPGDKIAWSIIPSVGVAHILLALDKVHYHVLQLTDLTLNVTSAIREELTALPTDDPAEPHGPRPAHSLPRRSVRTCWRRMLHLDPGE